MQPPAVGHSSARARLLPHQLRGLSVCASPPQKIFCRKLETFLAAALICAPLAWFWSDCIWHFAERHVDALLRHYSESPKLAKDLVPSVMLLPAGRGRAEKKQNRTSSDLSGEQLQSSSLPLGENAPEEAVSLSFYPPFSAPALLCSLWDMCSFIIQYSSFPSWHWIK